VRMRSDQAAADPDRPRTLSHFCEWWVGQQHDRGFIDLNAGQPPLAIRR
jgi:hypothetical protein